MRLLTVDPDSKFIDWIPLINLNPLECGHSNHYTRIPIFLDYYLLKNQLIKVIDI